MKYCPPVPANSFWSYRKIGTYKQIMKHTGMPQKLFDLWIGQMYKLGFIVAEPSNPFYLWYMDFKPENGKKHTLEFLYDFFRMSACLMFCEPPEDNKAESKSVQ